MAQMLVCFKLSVLAVSATSNSLISPHECRQLTLQTNILECKSIFFIVTNQKSVDLLWIVKPLQGKFLILVLRCILCLLLMHSSESCLVINSLADTFLLQYGLAELLHCCHIAQWSALFCIAGLSSSSASLAILALKYSNPAHLSGCKPWTRWASEICFPSHKLISSPTKSTFFVKSYRYTHTNTHHTHRQKGIQVFVLCAWLPLCLLWVFSQLCCPHYRIRTDVFTLYRSE